MGLPQLARSPWPFRRILAEASDECRAFAQTLPRCGLLAVLAAIAATVLTIISSFLLPYV